MTSSEFEYVEPIFGQVRHVSNYAHNTINSADVTTPEMPIPSFKGHDGFWNLSASNDRYDNGFIDFNFQSCTSGTKSWEIEYLLGASEHVGANPTPKFSRDNWDIKDAKEGETIGGVGTNMNNLWTSRGDAPFVLLDRSNNNVARRFSCGYVDCNARWGKPTTVDLNSNKKAHYIRAKGITFRYQIDFWEGTSLQGEETHGITPLRSMGLLFIKPSLGNVRDDKLYYAELLTEDYRIVGDDYGYLSYKGILDLRPEGSRETTRQYHNVHWKNDWDIIYQDTVKDPDTGEDKTILKTISGGGPWDEHGYRAHNKNYVSKSKTRSNKYPGKVTGCATLTLSDNAVKHIWRNDMVCVGFVVTGAHYNGGGEWTTGSSGNCVLYDVKLLEMEHSTDNEIVLSPEQSLESQYFSNLMRPACTTEDAEKYNRMSRNASNYEFIADLDVL